MSILIGWELGPIPMEPEPIPCVMYCFIAVEVWGRSIHYRGAHCSLLVLYMSPYCGYIVGQLPLQAISPKSANTNMNICLHRWV